MPKRNLFFEKNQPIHIIARAIEGKNIFYNEEDCYRFIFQIYAANMGSPALNLKRISTTKASMQLLRGEDISESLVIKKHSPLVDILDFSLVINHYHFCLLADSENEISLFMHNLNLGFGKYFNLKYKKRGPIFDGRYKSVLIETDFQINAIIRYINIINPLDVYQPGWRKNGLKNVTKSFEFLNNYQFSSFPDKFGKRRAKILAPENILKKYQFDASKKNLLDFAKNFLIEKSNSPLFIE